MSQVMGGAMPFLSPIQAAGGPTQPPQQGSQCQEVFGGDEGGSGQSHATARGAVEHPVGQFERWCGVGVVQPTPEHDPTGPGERGHDKDKLTGPRVPGVAHLATVADMGLV